MKRCAILLPLLLPLLLGCAEPAPESFQVTGTVTYQGKPLPLGSVMFMPRDEGARFKGSPIDANGRYQLEILPGRYAVQVQMIARLRGQRLPDGEGANVNVPEVDWLIPEKYSHFETSGIEVVVEPDRANQIDLPLK
ncbi:MAG TPA: hypothetical protein DD670_09085 [Planctomycetaceae bacterium]|nr:hypothetical protein [Planctomycetaceae bacterium]